MSVERLHFEPGQMQYHWLLATEHVARYAFAAQFCRGRRVLDVACGEGYGSYLLAQAGAGAVVGVDLSREAIAVAEARFAGPGIRYLVGDACNLGPLLADEAPFDLIVSFETIEHVPDVDAFLGGLAATRAPGAVVVISAPQEPGPAGHASANPFHQRVLSFEAFREATTRHLGPARSWHLGTPAQGVVICEAGTPLLENDRTDLSLMMEAAPGARGWMLPAQRDLAVAESGCAFFAGVWGADATTVVASAPASVAGLMEPWKAMEWLRAENASLRRELADPAAAGVAENGTRRARALSESLADLRRAMLLDRQRLEAAQARVQALTTEVETATARRRTTAQALAAAEARLADAQAARHAVPASLEQEARRAEAEAMRADEQARLAQAHALRANAAEAALAAERATVARLRAEWDMRVPALAREAERLKQIEASRGWRLVQAYARLLAHPVAGWPLRVARRLVSR